MPPPQSVDKHQSTGKKGKRTKFILCQREMRKRKRRAKKPVVIAFFRSFPLAYLCTPMKKRTENILAFVNLCQPDDFVIRLRGGKFCLPFISPFSDNTL